MSKRKWQPLISKVFFGGPRPITRFNKYVEAITDEPMYVRVGKYTVCVLRLKDGDGHAEPIGVGLAVRLDGDKPNEKIWRQISYGRAARDVFFKMRREMA